jgi:subtilisin family serine protease
MSLRSISRPFVFLVAISASVQIFAADGSGHFIVECVTDCSAVAAQVSQLGGQVTERFNNVAAIAVSVPAGKAAAVRGIAGVASVAKDATLSAPRPARTTAIPRAESGEVRVLPSQELSAFVAKRPANYNFNNLLTGADALHAEGILGEGVVVAVIDSGTANNRIIVPALAGSVIGGENFVDWPPDEPSATSTKNNDHGTMVGAMIAAHVLIGVPNTSRFVQSLLTHAPDSVIPVDDVRSLVPMIGTAPGASIYALKVFGAGSEGASTSTILAAMDRALTLKRNFKRGVPVTPVAGDGSEDNPFVYDALDIKVVNMSLGGPSLIPGLSVDDVLTREMLQEGITVVIAAGNEGPAAMTIGSPASGVGALSVGAANSAMHDRIWYDLALGLGAGLLYRPNDNLTTSYFSSRGPTADGRDGVHVLANGYSSFTQGADGSFAWVDGTSFATPTVSGAAALLWAAVPQASGAGVRSALIRGADDELLQDKSKKIDQGSGFINLPKSLAKLQAGDVSETIPKLPELGRTPQLIAKNIDDSDLEIVKFRRGRFSEKVELVPGQVAHFALPADLNTERFEIRISGITPELPQEQQNAVWGDDLFVVLVDAPTGFNELREEAFINGDTEYTIDKPQSGLLRLALGGDWTNAGKVSAKLDIVERRGRIGAPAAAKSVRDGQTDYYSLTIPAGVTAAQFQLAWNYDWHFYPAMDIDLYLIDPDDRTYVVWDPLGYPIFQGATLAAPERIEVPNPKPGVWTVVVDGYDLYGFRDRYRVWAADQSGQSFTLISQPPRADGLPPISPPPAPPISAP